MLESQPLDPNLIRLRQLVDASIRRDPGGESHIIANHMQQIEDLLIGQGVDFIPEQDPMGERSPFVQRFLNETNLQQYLPDIARKLMGSGEVLAWLRITPGGYRLRYYAREEFKPYYSPDSDDLTAATILSSYTVELPQGGVQRKWLKMVVLRQGTFVEESDSRPRMAGIGDRPDLDLSQSQQLMQGDKPQGLGNEVRFYPNPFDFLPLAVLKNKPTGPGQRSADDFSEFARQLVAHDATMRAIGQNVRKYARQTIFTNLPRNQIMKGGGGDGDRRYGNSGSFASDYYDAQQSAARRMGGGMPGQEEEIADVIGADSMPGESFINVLTWNPIQGDQLQYLEILEDKLHWSMGSISKRGGGTAYEVRANLSWPTATANKKAHNLFDRGICELIAGAIAHEENLYVLTGGLAGLTPAGPTRVKWRRVELVQPSPQDQLQTSILGRNLEEEGVGTPSILRLLFPDKTEQEIQAMTGGEGGVPFRKLEKTIPQLQAIYQTLVMLPPEIAMQLLPVTQLLTENLVEALNYGRTGTNPSPGPSADPAVIAAALSRVNPAGAAELLRATGHSDQLVSTDDQQPAGAVPSTGTTIGNPLSAFDRFRANFSGGLFSGAGRTP
jgi:hypothetical protein